MSKFDKCLCDALVMLIENYYTATTLKYVRNPIAWALYQTWKAFDGKERTDDRTIGFV